MLLILFVGWAVEEWRATQDRGHHGWLGLSCLFLVGVGAFGLITVGLL